MPQQAGDISRGGVVYTTSVVPVLGVPSKFPVRVGIPKVTVLTYTTWLGVAGFGRRNADLSAETDEFGDGHDPEFLHDASTMDLDRLLGDF